MAFGVPHTQACRVLPHQRRPPSLHSREKTEYLVQLHSLPTDLPALAPADERHAWRETSAWLRILSAGAGAAARAPQKKTAPPWQIQCCEHTVCCVVKNIWPIRVFVTGTVVSLLPSFHHSTLPTDRDHGQCVCREQSFVSAVGAQCLQTVRLTAVPCPPFPGALRRFLQTIRDPCPPANAETPDQDPRRLIPRSIILSPSAHLRLSTPSFHRLSAAALPPGRISPSRPTDLLFAHTTPAS